MHLNALYRSAKAGKQALAACVMALASASRTRRVLGMPIRRWHLRQARLHLAEAKRHLGVVRDNVPVIAAIGGGVAIDSSGGYAVTDLLVGGLLDRLVEIAIEDRVDATLVEVNDLLAQVGELMLRMRKAGAVS